MRSKDSLRGVATLALLYIVASPTFGQDVHPDTTRTPLAPTAAGGAPPPKIINGVPPGFELVRLTNDPTMQHSIPDINDRGEVVFEKFIPGTGDRNIHIFSEGAFRKITGDDTIDWRPVINNESRIVWNSGTDLEGLFGLETTDEDLQIPGEYRFASSKDINEAGDLVWSHFDEATGNIDVFHYDRTSGEVRKITDGGNNQSAHLNDHGQIVWRERDDSVTPWMSRIMLYSKGQIADITPSACQCQSTDINDLGHVVWKDSVGVYLWDGTTVRFIAPIGSTARVNDQDDIAFALWFDDEQLWKHALYRDEIIYVLENYGFSTARSAINNRGEIVMGNFDNDNGHTELFLLRRVAPKGDFNHDCVIDLYDFSVFQRCLGVSPGPEGHLLAECIRGDFDDDGDVDVTDFSCFLDESTGPDRSVDQCKP